MRPERPAGASVGDRMGVSIVIDSFLSRARTRLSADHSSRRGFRPANTVDVGATHAKRLENRARRGHGAIDIDAAAGILDHHHVEALAARIFGRIAHAEIEGEAGQEDPPEAALAQIAGEAGMGLAIVFVERRIGIDVAMIALAQNQLGVRDLQVLRGTRPPAVPCTQWSGQRICVP